MRVNYYEKQITMDRTRDFTVWVRLRQINPVVTNSTIVLPIETIISISISFFLFLVPIRTGNPHSDKGQKRKDSIKFNELPREKNLYFNL